MQRKKKLVKAGLSVFFILVMLTSLTFLVSAQGLFDANINNKAVTSFFKNTFGAENVSIRDTIMFLAIFVMFFVAFSDIIDGFTLFSKRTSYIIGFVLALIGALSKVVLVTANLFLGISAWAGTLSIFVALITAFAAFTLLHLGIGKLAGFTWAMKRQKAIAAAKSKGLEAAKAARFFEEFQKATGV